MAHVAAATADRGISTTAWRKFGKAIESGRLFDLEEAESWELEEPVEWRVEVRLLEV